MYDSNGKRMTSQVTSQRDYTLQPEHPDLITEVPDLSPTSYEDWERFLSPDWQAMWVCTECYSAYHSGDFSPTNDTSPFSEFNLEDGAPAIHTYVLDGISTFFCDLHTDEEKDCDDHRDECEIVHFSTRACDACSTFLAGTRFAMMYDANVTNP